MKKFNFEEEFFVKIMLYAIILLFYILATYSFLSFLFWPKEALVWYDYVLEIIAYTFLGSLLLIKRKSLLKKLV